ncbi:MAG TPA: hypothetical protein VEG44_06480 [Candidatus Acidoferrales bacterium]|nr:hypothetical protein [Candidatus Acidoferrales bacterium]
MGNGIISLFAVATKDSTAVLKKETVLCLSGQVGLRFGTYLLDYVIRSRDGIKRIATGAFFNFMAQLFYCAFVNTSS